MTGRWGAEPPTRSSMRGCRCCSGGLKLTSGASGGSADLNGLSSVNGFSAVAGTTGTTFGSSESSRVSVSTQINACTRAFMLQIYASLRRVKQSLFSY